MIAVALVLLAQAPAAAEASRPERFSILVDPCASARDAEGKDIVVCGRADAVGPRLPMRDLRGPPDRAVPSNPDMSAAVALNGPSARGECGLYGENCPVGGGGYVLPKLVGGAAGAVAGLLNPTPTPDRRGRVPIPLEDPAPPAAKP